MFYLDLHGFHRGADASLDYLLEMLYWRVGSDKLFVAPNALK